MKKSPLWKYYSDNYPTMLNNIIRNKDYFGHKNTSALLFQAETNLMSEILKECEEYGIICIYIFDAVAVRECDYDQMVDIMNYIVEEHKINTKAE